ncbi:MAG: gamma-glutamyltransferase [Planctomycetes bacterium]|nr:gamma-glutamyltransferase [Planctomycetota bacterium]
MKSLRKLVSIGFIAVFTPVACSTSVASEKKPVEFRNGVVVAVSEPGAEAGLAILKQGGNAVDAAVATAFAMAVTHPAAGNIGGGGFMLVHPAKGDPTVIDYRETAPAAATKTMFKKGDSPYSHRVVGVPGAVRGMALAHQKFGKLPWKTLVMPAVELAEKGYILDKHHASSLNANLHPKSRPEFLRAFRKPDGTTWKSGDRHVQPDLAKTLRLIAEDGPDAFYTGKIADLIVAEMKAGDGLITKEDLAAYKAIQRKPIVGSYRGYDVYGPPPPSSGGICLMQMLGILERFDVRKNERYSPQTLHLMAEAMRRSYCDRARHLGDPAFTKIPDHLLTPDYIGKLAKSIDLAKATPSADLAKEIPLTDEGESTTHFSVIDKDGMAVASTYTLEHGYGSRIVVKDAGFLLNNEMMDFNWRPGITTKAGAIGTEPNTVAPGKRMLSSQTPTIVATKGKVVLVTGSPGGRTIINTVFNIVVSVIDYDMPIQEAVDGPRTHHQWFPDRLSFEGTTQHRDTIKALEALGHRVVNSKQGDAHSILVNPRGGYTGAADKRLSGKVSGY